MVVIEYTGHGLHTIKKMRHKILFIPILSIQISLLTALFLVNACQSGNSNKEIDSPTAGKINIAVDETYQPILDSELMVFAQHYPNAHISVKYMPYAQLIEAFMEDSIRMIITSQSLSPAQSKRIEGKIRYIPKEAQLGYDAVACIAHPSSGKMSLTKSELAKIIRGEISEWSQLSFKSPHQGKIGLVFDNANSSTARYMIDSLIDGGTMSANCFALNNNVEVIDYISKNSNAIGIIGVNWISNNQDDQVQYFRKEIATVGIIDNDSIGSVHPYQAYIASAEYPLRRTMKGIIKEAGPGLGHGFANFIGGEQGQRIILKSGLVPATMPTRQIRIKEKL